MSIRVDSLSACEVCGGKRYPLILCEACGAGSVLRDLPELDRTAACSECGAANPWQLICDTCENRTPAPDFVESPPVAQGPKSERSAGPPQRPRRRVKGDVDTRALMDLLKVLGLDASRAHALIDRGYDAVWKIARANEETLARIPEVGPIAARKMLASFHLLKYSPPKRTKESIAQDEYVCPLCGCVTSAFAAACVECGAVFDEEEMEEDVRHAFAVEGISALLAFYEGRLAEKPEDWELSYARGLLLESLGRIDEAIASLEDAGSKAPDAKKVRVAQLRMRARAARKPEGAAKLRSTAKDLLEDVAWEEEVAQLDRVISKAERECPSCGTIVPAEMALCPSCGARLTKPVPPPPKPKQKVASATPELDAVMDDLLVGELEESLSEEELELTKAAVLDWLIMELEESMAPDAQVLRRPVKRPVEAAETTPPAPPTSPLTDSIGFISRWMRGSRGLVSGVRPKRGPTGSGRVNGLVNGQGRVNGLVNGVGRTNGLVNGLGRVNGLATPVGRVNGLVTTRGRVNGLVMGQGRINGVMTGAPFQRSRIRGLALPFPSRRVRYVATISAVVAACLIAAVLFLPPPVPSAPIAIDGAFDDWASVPKFDVATSASDPNVSLASYASLLDRDSLYLFASTAGAMFGDSIGYDGVDFLIDSDGNASTGFQFGGTGADAMVEVFGGNGTVAGASLYSFPADSERNWSRRVPGGVPSAAASASGVEVKVSRYDLDRFDPLRFRASVYADDFLGSSSQSLASLSSSNGAILLVVKPLTTIVGSGLTSLFEIRVHAVAIPATTTWPVSGFLINATPGVSYSRSAESVNLTQGRPDPTVSVSVSAPGFFPGDVIEASVLGADAPVPVFVQGGPVRAYVTAPPSHVQIDGLFDDWLGRDVPDGDPTPVADPNLNILESGAATSNATAFVHVRVAGTMLGGGIPERVPKQPRSSGNGSSGGGSAMLPRKTGEDLLLVYIDSNASDPRGASIGGIFADYLVEVRGQGGEMTTTAAYRWSNRWVRDTGIPVRAEKDRTDIEASVPIPDLNGTRVFFQSTNWASAGDATIPVTAPSFVPPGPRMSPRSLAPPQPQGFAGSTFYLRDVNPGLTTPDCSVVKGLNTTKGSGAASLPLSAGTQACFFTDPAASAQSISGGSWSASLDLSATGTTLNVTFALTDQNGSSPNIICWSNRTTTLGTNESFGCTSAPLSVQANQRIRLRIEFIAGPSTNLAYDGSGTSQDSSIIVPAPEFDPATTLFALVGTAGWILVLRRRRRLA